MSGLLYDPFTNQQYDDGKRYDGLTFSCRVTSIKGESHELLFFFSYQSKKKFFFFLIGIEMRTFFFSLVCTTL